MGVFQWYVHHVLSEPAQLNINFNSSTVNLTVVSAIGTEETVSYDLAYCINEPSGLPQKRKMICRGPTGQRASPLGDPLRLGQDQSSLQTSIQGCDLELWRSGRVIEIQTIGVRYSHSGLSFTLIGDHLVSRRHTGYNRWSSPMGGVLCPNQKNNDGHGGRGFGVWGMGTPRSYQGYSEQPITGLQSSWRVQLELNIQNVFCTPLTCPFTGLMQCLWTMAWSNRFIPHSFNLPST